MYSTIFCTLVAGGLFCLSVLSCKQTPATSNEPTTASDSTAAQRAIPSVDWAKNATIYEVNVRQFSPEGTFKAVEQQLTRLKELGVDILWVMPIHPISKENQQTLPGNPYAVEDYKAVNPEYGTMADFKALVKQAHDLGMHVIIDWVPNHTGRAHTWVKQHPDWYTQINKKMSPPIDERGKVTDRPDVFDLNYKNPELRSAMIDAMQFWVRECDIDGYRCEVAGYVPDDFWAEVRPKLDSLKPVFMLAEWEENPEHFRECFNMNYGWSTYQLLKLIAKGKRPATAIDSLLAHNQKRFPHGYYQMQFTQNHDENAWAGTGPELFGNGTDAFTVLAYTFDGMPMMYNGMESNLSKRLKFYEKDPIYWGNYGKTDFYKTLLTLKHRNRALWNGLAGGRLIKIPTEKDDKVYAFFRQQENDRVVVIVNLSPTPQTIRLNGDGFEGVYTEVFSRQPTELRNSLTFALKPWEYKVYTN
ncbi:alpha-amylase family glycosyl hydrolase [Larkinella rosea]|uniref:Alpha-amylase n=1 Tax=Larkinella rosea TaxID=2025312 RepID=A0A3P1C153_9BACT|nr:alpha-amylase family glycosyl hydrolase [Larkinella rosea]RRB07125.1 alpha-amylase [Larkinella rosea]